jgi:LPXTG-motif cell wall-anchored protein
LTISLGRLPLRRLPRTLLPVGAGLAALLTATPAAAATTLPLHSAHRGSTAAGFSSKSCDQIPGSHQGAGSDGFVFVLPGNDAGFVSLTLKFQPAAGGEVTVHITDASDPYPDGIINDKGTSKAWVVVPAGWKLLDGTATVDNDATKADDFNLTHTCPGGGSTPSPSPSVSPSPSASVSPSTGGSGSPSPSDSGSVEGSSAVPSGTVTPTPGGGGGGGGGGGLPVTGVALTSMTMTAAGLIAAGVALLMVRRRRDLPTFVADGPAPAGDDPERRPSPQA